MITLWWRAFSIVTLTALNVTQVTSGNWVGMFLSGGALSYVWWGNSQKAAKSLQSGTKWDALVYAFGAACGTVFGTLIGRYFGKAS